MLHRFDEFRGIHVLTSWSSYIKLSATASRVSTCESNLITSGQTVENTLQLNQQGGGRIDIPLPESENTFNDVSILTKVTATITNTLKNIGTTTIGSDAFQVSRPSLYDTKNYYRSTSAENVSIVESGSRNSILFQATLDLTSIHQCFNSLSNLGDGSYIVTYFVKGQFSNVSISPLPNIARIKILNNSVTVSNCSDICYFLVTTSATGSLTISGIDIISVMLIS